MENQTLLRAAALFALLATTFAVPHAFPHLEPRYPDTRGMSLAPRAKEAPPPFSLSFGGFTFLDEVPQGYFMIYDYNSTVQSSECTYPQQTITSQAKPPVPLNVRQSCANATYGWMLVQYTTSFDFIMLIEHTITLGNGTVYIKQATVPLDCVPQISMSSAPPPQCNDDEESFAATFSVAPAGWKGDAVVDADAAK